MLDFRPYESQADCYWMKIYTLHPFQYKTEDQKCGTEPLELPDYMWKY